MAIHTRSVGAAGGATGVDAFKDSRPLEKGSWGDVEREWVESEGRNKEGSEQV